MTFLKKIKDTLSFMSSFDSEELECVAKSDPEGSKAFLSHSYLQDLLPYRLYDPKTGIFENEDSFGFAFIIPPLAGVSETKEEELEQLITSLYYEGGACQFLLFADPFIGPLLDHWGDLLPGSPKIVYRTIERRKNFFRSEVINDNPVLKVPPRNFSVLVSYSVPKNSETISERFQRKLLSHKRNTFNILTRITQNERLVQEMTPPLLIHYVSNLVGMDLNIHCDAQKYSDKMLINQQIQTGGGVEVSPTGCVFRSQANMLFKMFQVTDLPSNWSIFDNPQLIGDPVDDSYRLQTPFFVHYGISYASQSKIKSSLMSKELLIKNQLRSMSFLNKNPKMLEESAEYNYALRKYEEGEKFVTTRLNVGIWGAQERFQDSYSALVALYRKNGLKLKETTFLHFDDFLRSLPMSWGSYVVNHALKKSRCTRTSMTGHSANLCPIFADFCGFSSRGTPLISRKGQLTFFDPFSNSTKSHTSVIGPTGAGKSCFLNEMIFNFRANKRRVFVIDKGGSFRNLCSLLGGQYISFEPGDSFDLNPFSFLDQKGLSNDKSAKDNGNPFADMMETLKAIIRTMYEPDGNINPKEKTTLDRAVEIAWKTRGTAARIDDVVEAIEKEVNYTTDINNAKREDLIERLKLFCSDGCYGKWLYGQKKIKFQSDLVIIETNNLDALGDLKPVILQTYFLMISREIYTGDRTQMKGFVIDECHNLIKSPQWAYAIQLGTREYRKFNAAMILATQGLKDFSTKEAREAFTNSEWVITMGSGTEALSTIKKDNLLPLDAYEEEILSSLRKEKRFSEVAIRSESSQHTTVYRFRMDPFSLQLFSTNPTDYERFRVMREKGFDIEHVIDWMIPLKDKFRCLDEAKIHPKDQIEQLLSETSLAMLQKLKGGTGV
ncbi:TraC family protein [Simkania negevensis]|uniref:Conjugal transfer ATPase TraC n=1 Tax=Simkania negevensis (strain ATCC VR-1471 / DSM 27360 / Z) TaxID=331113 RepID=F8L2Y7_SIMNZ|nr:TraC family protein [Simkania negevensis]CCB87833.1 conjugal transfer ATPase TraC [Simkania negevensis Z]